MFLMSAAIKLGSFVQQTSAYPFYKLQTFSHTKSMIKGNGNSMGVKKLDLKDIIQQAKDISKMDDDYHSLIATFPLKMIESDKENKLALVLSQRLIEFLNRLDSKPKGIVQYLKTLTHLIYTYENDKFKSTRFSGRDMLTYLMELHDLKQTDLSTEVGGQPVVSALLKGTRELNTKQIKALSKRFNVSPVLFIE